MKRRIVKGPWEDEGAPASDAACPATPLEIARGPEWWYRRTVPVCEPPPFDAENVTPEQSEALNQICDMLSAAVALGPIVPGRGFLEDNNNTLQLCEPAFTLPSFGPVPPPVTGDVK